MEYDNTRRDQIDICNPPRLYTIARTLRQKQYFENSQIPGETRKNSISKKKIIMNIFKCSRERSLIEGPNN